MFKKKCYFGKKYQYIYTTNKFVVALHNAKESSTNYNPSEHCYFKHRIHSMTAYRLGYKNGWIQDKKKKN